MKIDVTQDYSCTSSLSFGQNRYTKGIVSQEDNKKNEERSSILAADLGFHKQEDSFLESLKEQYRAYQEELNSLSTNEELTVEEKLAKRKEIQEQINGIKDQIVARQQQLQQLEKEKTQKEIEKRQKESATNQKDITEEEYQNRLHQNFLTEASTVMSEVGSLNRLKVKTKGELKVASKELELSMARAGGVSESLSNNVSEANQRLSKLDMKFSEKLGKLNKLVKNQKDELISQSKDTKYTVSSKEKQEEVKAAKENANNPEQVDKDEKQKDRENWYDKRVDVLI